MSKKPESEIVEEVAEAAVEEAKNFGVGKIAMIAGAIASVGGISTGLSKLDEINAFICKERVKAAVSEYKNGTEARLNACNQARVCYETASRMLDIDDSQCKEVYEDALIEAEEELDGEEE